MLRFLRIVAIIVFSILVGYSANALWKMHESGELTEQYNSSRKANITLLVSSVIALSVLGFYELSGIRARAKRYRYGSSQRQEHEDSDAFGGLDSSSIYAAPKTIDKWEGRRTRTSKSRKKHSSRAEGPNIWLGLLRISCLVIFIFYAFSLVQHLMAAEPADPILVWLLPSAYGLILLVSVVTIVGVLRQKMWGLGFGYLLAICNLMIFPVGTALGLFLLMGLVGSTQQFAVPEREKHRDARRKSAHKARAMV